MAENKEGRSTPQPSFQSEQSYEELHISTYNDYSVWLDPPHDIAPHLTGDRRAEMVIIGGGYTGLMAAITLVDRGVDVALLDQQFCGFGASGRNAGHISPTIGRNLASCLKQFGKDKTVRLAHFAEEAVQFTEETFKQYGIDCDYEPTGNIAAGVHPSQRGALVKLSETSAQLGFPMPFIDESEMRRRNLPAAFQFGVYEEPGGLINPGKYVSALRQIALQKGVLLYERSPVSAINSSGSDLKIDTDSGSIRCTKALNATNGFTAPRLNRLRDVVAPLRVTLFETRPLTDNELSQLGWQERQGIFTAHNALENYRLTADNRLHGGSKWIQYGFGSTLVDGNQPAVFADFEALVKVRFPELQGVSIENFWGGWIGITMSSLPFCAQDRSEKQLFHCVGYNGHGVPQATRLGHLAALEMLGEKQEVLSLFAQPRTLPPEPFRWLGITAFGNRMKRFDRRLDREIAGP